MYVHKDADTTQVNTQSHIEFCYYYVYHAQVRGACGEQSARPASAAASAPAACNFAENRWEIPFGYAVSAGNTQRRHDVEFRQKKRRDSCLSIAKKICTWYILLYDLDGNIQCVCA